MFNNFKMISRTKIKEKEKINFYIIEPSIFKTFPGISVLVITRNMRQSSSDMCKT